MIYKRNIIAELEKEITTKQIIVVTGMRQVGKTTALKYVFNKIESDNKIFLDLENPLNRKLFEEENFDNVWINLRREYGIDSSKRSYIFIDEIQHLPVISQVVKYLHEHWDVKFFLTGSSSYYLKNLFPESLSARKFVYEMYPLSFKEYLLFNDVKTTNVGDFDDLANSKSKIHYERLISYYREYLEFGGFPAVVLEKDPERKTKTLETIFTSYFEQDVKTLSDFQNLSIVRDLILILVPRVGSKIDISKLASELSISRQTVYSLLSFLESTYFIKLLIRYSKSVDRRVTGAKKLFLCDPGMANFLGKISQGQVLEQAIFNNLRTEHGLNFYSKRDWEEIDFIVDSKIALEVKTTASERDVNKLKRNASKIGIENSFVVSLTYSDLNEVILATDL